MLMTNYVNADLDPPLVAKHKPYLRQYTVGDPDPQQNAAPLPDLSPDCEPSSIRPTSPCPTAASAPSQAHCQKKLPPNQQPAKQLSTPPAVPAVKNLGLISVRPAYLIDPQFTHQQVTCEYKINLFIHRHLSRQQTPTDGKLLPTCHILPLPITTFFIISPQ